MPEQNDSGGQTGLLGAVLCWLGIHDYRVIESTFGFGPGSAIEKVECRRCGDMTTRRA